MGIESEAEWTFEQFESAVATSASRVTPVPPVEPVVAAVAAVPVESVAAVEPAVPGAPAVPDAPAAFDASAQLGLAQGIAFVAHRGQFDRIGAEYIDHPARVAERFDAASEPLEAATAWLHDVLEDTSVTVDDLILAGVHPEIVEAVRLLTRTPEVDDDAYYAGIRRNPVALRVKLADIADNTAPWRTRRLDADTRAKLAEKYARARAALGDG